MPKRITTTISAEQLSEIKKGCRNKHPHDLEGCPPARAAVRLGHLIDEFASVEAFWEWITDGMTRTQKTVFLYRYRDGLFYREISKRMGITHQAIAEHRRKAMSYAAWKVLMRFPEYNEVA